jgi:hypothetical protein
MVLLVSSIRQAGARHINAPLAGGVGGDNGRSHDDVGRNRQALGHLGIIPLDAYDP